MSKLTRKTLARMIMAAPLLPAPVDVEVARVAREMLDLLGEHERLLEENKKLRQIIQDMTSADRIVTAQQMTTGGKPAWMDFVQVESRPFSELTMMKEGFELVCTDCGTFPRHAGLLDGTERAGDLCPAGNLDDYDCVGTLE